MITCYLPLTVRFFQVTMFAAQERLTPVQRECAVFGFIREASSNSIPSDLMKLHLRYYEEELDWTINGNEYQKFIEADPDTKFESITCNYKNIEWNLTIYPNGKYYSKGYVQLYATFTQIPPNISFIDVLIKLSVDNATSRTLCYRVETKKHILSVGLRPYQLKLSTIKDMNMKSVTIRGYVEIGGIGYKSISDSISEKNEPFDPLWFSPRTIKLKENMHFEWNIDHLLDGFKDCYCGQAFESDVFGDYNQLILRINPNGIYRHKDTGCCIVGFQMIRMPAEVHTVYVDYELILITDKETTRFKEYADVDREGPWIWTNDIYSYDAIQACTKATIHIDMVVKKVIDNDKEEVHRDEWVKFGIE